MHQSWTALVLTAAPWVAHVSAYYRDPTWGNAMIVNKCGNNAFFIQDNDAGSTSTINPGSTATVPMYYKAATPFASNPGGPSIKIVHDTGDLYSGAALTQFEFTPGDYDSCPGPWCQSDKVSYDVSNVNTNGGTGMNGNGQEQSGLPPFMAGGLAMSSPQDVSVNAECGACVNPCPAFYTGNSDNGATHQTGVTNDLVLTLCSDSSADGRMMGPQAHGQYCSGGNHPSGPVVEQAAPQVNNAPPAASSSQPAASPAPSAPVFKKLVLDPATPEHHEKEVVVTVTAWAPTVTEHVVKNVPAKERRHDHVHAHAHPKINKRRHGA